MTEFSSEENRRLHANIEIWDIMSYDMIDILSSKDFDSCKLTEHFLNWNFFTEATATLVAAAIAVRLDPKPIQSIHSMLGKWLWKNRLPEQDIPSVGAIHAAKNEAKVILKALEDAIQRSDDPVWAEVSWFPDGLRERLGPEARRGNIRRKGKWGARKQLYLVEDIRKRWPDEMKNWPLSDSYRTNSGVYRTLSDR